MISNLFQQDFDFFINTLRDTHPNIKANLPEFDQVAEKLRAELGTETDTLKFEAKLRQFTHKLGDAHTGIWSSNSKQKSFYPISVEWFEEGWYISRIDSLHTEAIGSKIVSINGIEADAALTTMMSLISGENIHWFRAQVSKILSSEASLRLLGLAAEDGLLYLDLDKAGITSRITLHETETAIFAYPIRNGVSKYDSVPYWGRALPEESVFYLQFNQFSDAVADKDKPFGDWMAFLDKSFATIDSLNIRNIIVDLRDNGGGNSTLGDIFLSYCSLPDSLYCYTGDVCFNELFLKNNGIDLPTLLDALAKETGESMEGKSLPFIYSNTGDQLTKTSSSYLNYWKGNGAIAENAKKLFEGRIILLMGSNSFSSAVDFATQCKDNGLAIIYGTPSGGKPSCFGDVLSFNLPNTKINCGVSFKYFRRPDFNKDPADSLPPDVFLALDPDSYFAGKDLLLEKVLQDIRINAVPDLPARY